MVLRDMPPKSLKKAQLLFNSSIDPGSNPTKIKEELPSMVINLLFKWQI